MDLGYRDLTMTLKDTLFSAYLKRQCFMVICLLIFSIYYRGYYKVMTTCWVAKMQ